MIIFYYQLLSGLGYISVDLLREILKELDEKLSPADLEQMIEEIDTDGSGTVDWEGCYYLLHIILIQLSADGMFERFNYIRLLQNSKQWWLGNKRVVSCGRN